MIYASATHEGCIRRLNEDSFYAADGRGPLQYVLVADGMGGHNAGEVASAMVAKTISEILDEGQKKPVITLMREAINEANLRVFDRASRADDFTGMGTTLVLAVADDKNVCVANVGDSRAYLFETKRNKLIQVTRDHSLVEELIAAGRLRREDAAAYPYRNVVTRAVGTSVQVEPDIFMQPWHKEDMLLLCTDGLTTHLSDGRIRHELKKNAQPQQVCDTLIALTLSDGARDNVTVVILKNSESAGEVER